MIELTLTVSDIDYDALLRTFGGAVGPAAAAAARLMPDSAREELAVRYLNSNADKLSSRLEAVAAAKGLPLRISGARAVKR